VNDPAPDPEAVGVWHPLGPVALEISGVVVRVPEHVRVPERRQPPPEPVGQARDVVVQPVLAVGQERLDPFVALELVDDEETRSGETPVVPP